MVFKFTGGGAKITAIDLIADPDRLSQLDLIAPLEEHAYPRNHAATP